MLYVSFVYTADADMLAILAARLQAIDPQAEIYAISDPDAPLPPDRIPPGVQHRLGTVSRGGNLNGLPIIAEELEAFVTLMELTGHREIIKIDADCYPIQLDALEASTAHLTICERYQPLTPAGMVYKIKLAMARSLRSMFSTRTERGLWQTGAQYPEDLTIFALSALTNKRVKLLPYAEHYAAGMPDAAPSDIPDRVLAAHFVHCGEPLASGQRVTRDHATLRMRCLHARVTSSA